MTFAAPVHNKSIRFRARSFVAFTLTPEAPLDVWLESLDHWIGNSPGYFTGRPVLLDLNTLKPGPEELVALVGALGRRGIRVYAIELEGAELGTELPPVLTGFDKTFLSAPRLLHILALAYLIAVVPGLSNIARTAPDHPLAILGKHSLPVFVAGTLLAMVSQVLKQVNPGGLPYDTLLIATGIVMQFALAYYLEWLPTIGWGGKGAAAKAKPAEPARGNARPAMQQS